MTRAPKNPFDGTLVIDVGWQGDGGVYMLDLRSREDIHKAFPGANVIPLIHVGYDKAQDYERFHRPYWKQITRMLTGLTPEQIRQLGGVRLYDPEGKKWLWEWQTDKANGQ